MEMPVGASVERGRRVASFWAAVAPRLFGDLLESGLLPPSDPEAEARARDEWEAFALHACVRGLVAASGFTLGTGKSLDAFHAAVLERTGLHCTVGIGDTLVRAKVATGFGKPRGVFRLTAENWLEVMGDRPTIDLWGVGSRISQRLAKLGITTVAELAAARPAPMIEEFGPRMGPWYALLGRGEGAREVDDTPWVARGHSRETTYQQDLVDPADVEAALRELAARVLDDVAAEGRPVIGLTLKSWVEAALDSLFVIGLCLVATGTLLFLAAVARNAPRAESEIGLADALIIGSFQALALLPGVSRSGTTISSGVLRRIRPDVATRFSFLLGIPAIAGALVLEGKDVASLAPELRLPLALGVATAYVTGLAAIAILLRVVRTGRLQYFAYYCWALGIALAAAGAIGVA